MLKLTVSILIVEQHGELKDLIHDLDVWHKSVKLVKALTDVSNVYTLSYHNNDNYY